MLNRIEQNLIGSETSDTERVRLLQEIAKVEPKIEWATYIPNQSYGIEISLPHGCFITGTLNVLADGKGTMKIDMFQVNEKLKSKGAGTGSGIGTRLLEALVREAKELEVLSLSGHVTSKSALATRAKVCGKENLMFYNPLSGAKINKSYEEIMGETGNVNDENLNYYVVADLTKVHIPALPKRKN